MILSLKPPLRWGDPLPGREVALPIRELNRHGANADVIHLQRPGELQPLGLRYAAQRNVRLPLLEAHGINPHILKTSPLTLMVGDGPGQP